MRLAEKLIDMCEGNAVGQGEVITNRALGANPLDLVRVKDFKTKEDIWLTGNTKLSNIKSLGELKIGDKVSFAYKSTPRGNEAISVSKKLL